MLISQIARPGEKIDIQLVQQLEQAKKNSDVEVKLYKSSIFDFKTDEDMQIMMPTENGKIVLFQVGLRIKMMFYTQKGLYICYGVVTKRYKKENFLLLEISVPDDAVKFQRREFYRMESSLEFKFIPIDENLAHLESTEEIFDELTQNQMLNDAIDAFALDISGGGLRFTSERNLSEIPYVLCILSFRGEKTLQTCYLVLHIIDSIKNPRNSARFISRGQFIFKDLHDRETIVRYIFEEERRIRRKELR